MAPINYKANTTKRHFLLGFLLFFCCCSVYAKHIIGGEITYECLGDDRYLFTLKIYRDCFGGGAQFDNPAIIGTYRQTSGGSYTLLDRQEVQLGSTTPLIADDYPCLDIPPNICVEEAIYTFQKTLSNIPNSYHISYQRCCRNNTITNLIAPEDAGATYTIELTPRAQDLCNSSPVYNDFPPIVICTNQPIDFDHSATDPDGDQLVYEFCSPILGGGTLGTPENEGDPGACNGVAPNPPCQPPYNNVSFTVPTYTATNPMGGDPQITIDPNTGLISGIPTERGQFVVGVCVKEYRNGELLSFVRRDFQFNVEICQPTVVADIEEDIRISDHEFLINLCGDTTLQLVNQSFQEQNIEEFRWEFDLGQGLDTLTEWEPFLVFPGLGAYQGTLLLNPGTPCNDTAIININIFPDITADFSYAYDTCVAGEVSFTDLSTTGATQLTDWRWNLIDSFSNMQDVDHQFSFPGEIPVELWIQDNNMCQDSITQTIEWFPAPAVLNIQPDTFIGCEPLTLTFNNLSTPIDSTYDIVWNFGDGGSSTGISPTYTYEEEGSYTVDLSVTSPIGCYIDTVLANTPVQVFPSPIAAFSFDPDDPSNLKPTVSFTDESIEPASWYWEFGAEDISYDQNPAYTFKDTGIYDVKLYITHMSGCPDSVIQRIDVAPEIRYHLPNAFTPNSDNVNDLFRGAGIFEGITNFELTIWNRWGELIFETNDPDEAWNGQKYNTGSHAPEGVYVCIVNYTGPRNNAVQLKGFATLLR